MIGRCTSGKCPSINSLKLASRDHNDADPGRSRRHNPGRPQRLEGGRRLNYKGFFWNPRHRFFLETTTFWILFCLEGNILKFLFCLEGAVIGCFGFPFGVCDIVFIIPLQAARRALAAAPPLPKQRQWALPYAIVILADRPNRS